MAKKITLGTKVRDTITGFVGVAVAYDLFINGCERYAVQAPCKKGDTKPPDMVWIDSGQLVAVDPPKKKPTQRRTGGPRAEKPLPNAR